MFYSYISLTVSYGFVLFFEAIRVCPFVIFLLTIDLSVLLRFTDYDYPFGTSNYYLQNIT